MASIVGLTLLMPAGPVLAAAPATQACPTDVDAPVPSLALMLKNAGQELRAAGSFLRASQCFRGAVEELPDCAAYADERLRWGLWATEDLERAEPGKNPDMHTFLERQVALLEASPEGRALTDLPLLVAARDRQRPARRGAGATTPAATSRNDRVALALIAGGAPLMITGAVLTGVFKVRDARLLDRLGALNMEGNDAGCTAAPLADEPGRCADLRALSNDAHEQRRTATSGLITGIALLGVGAGLLAAGLVAKLHGPRRSRRAASLRLLPAGAGMVLRGQF